MGSSRLPGKVLMPLAGEPMLGRVVDRIRHARSVDEVVVATSEAPADDAIESLCRARDVSCFRGSESDVLSRYRAAAAAHSADAVVRITSDCPLIDPALVDAVVCALSEPDDVDYAANIIVPRTFPRGLDAEAMTASTLERLHRLAIGAPMREHVTLFVHHHSDQFRMRGVYNDTDCSAQRWTVDTHEDFEFVSRIYSCLGSNDFAWTSVQKIVKSHPEWQDINAHVEQKLL